MMLIPNYDEIWCSPSLFDIYEDIDDNEEDYDEWEEKEKRLHEEEE